MRLIQSIVLISFILCCQSTTLTIAQIYQCSCGNISTETYCTGTYCSWDTGSSTCSNKACSSFLLKDDCQGVPDPFNCVWNQTQQKCESFTKCSDYKFNESDAEYCYDLIKCQVDLDNYDDTTKTIGCMDQSSSTARSIAKCDGVPYSECFWLTTADGKQCLQNTTTQKCEANTITSCADYKNYDNCNRLACYWNDTTNTCTVITCAVIPKADCYMFLTVDMKSATFCKWNDATSVCQDLDVTTLKDTECLGNTLYSYLWNPDTSKCELCTSVDSTSSAQIISLAGIILISLFV